MKIEIIYNRTEFSFSSSYLPGRSLLEIFWTSIDLMILVCRASEPNKIFKIYGDLLQVLTEVLN